MSITEKKEVLSSVDTLNIGDCTVNRSRPFLLENLYLQQLDKLFIF